VVLCNPVGWEALASQRAYRLLGDLLAEAGFPVLRFDYDGTGDSEGDDEDPQRVQAWLQSLAEAVSELRAVAQVTEVSLVGIHLGATLAACHALEKGDIASLVLWNVFPQGKTFVRQTRAYQQLNSPGASSSGEGLEAAGFQFAPQTVASLSALNVLEPSRAPARAALVLSRDDAALEAKLADRWRAQGCEVTTEVAPGYAALMQEPRKSVVPTATFECIRDWLVSHHPDTREAIAPKLPDETPELLGREFKDTAHRFGRDVFGLLTEPKHPRPDAPALIFLNTAADHRVGPHRMYVRWARTFASHGYTSLRFDPTGVGDGPLGSEEDGHAYSERRLEDLREALAFLRSRGHTRFVLFGLCSGAYVAFHAGIKEDGVVAEVLINPQTFEWKQGDSLELKVRGNFKSNRFYRQALWQKETWERALRGEVNVRGTVQAIAHRALVGARNAVARRVPFVAGNTFGVEHALRQKLERGTRVLFIFSESDGGLDYLEGEVGKDGGRFRDHGHFHLRIFPGPDHTFSRVSDQRALATFVLDHLLRHYPWS
jgi:pimeloyl-ACP methyl ester carboxylesterase